MRSKITLDRPSFHTDDEFVMSDRADMPNTFDYVAMACYMRPTDLEPLDTAHWRVQPPPAGGRNGLVVTFPEPLDHGLLMRALGVTRDGKEVEGEVAVDQLETRYQLLALDILEDVAGNQIGRAFEVDNFESVDKGPNPQTITIPFLVKQGCPRERGWMGSLPQHVPTAVFDTPDHSPQGAF
jgi:hypothetical protein